MGGTRKQRTLLSIYSERHSGWKARYVKEVDKYENTIRFYQEIFDDKGKLVEIHVKFPEDTGHKKIE